MIYAVFTAAARVETYHKLSYNLMIRRALTELDYKVAESKLININNLIKNNQEQSEMEVSVNNNYLHTCTEALDKVKDDLTSTISMLNTHENNIKTLTSQYEEYYNNIIIFFEQNIESCNKKNDYCNAARTEAIFNKIKEVNVDLSKRVAEIKSEITKDLSHLIKNYTDDHDKHLIYYTNMYTEVFQKCRIVTEKFRTGAYARIAEVEANARIAEAKANARIAEVEANARIAEAKADARIAEVEAKADARIAEAKAKATEIVRAAESNEVTEAARLLLEFGKKSSEKH